MTDCWGGYRGLAEHGFVHTTVNHDKVILIWVNNNCITYFYNSQEYVNSEDGTHTNRIESEWRQLKRKAYINYSFYLTFI